MYILQCADGSYYTGSTKDLERRLAQHRNGEGANFTRKHLPVKLAYYEEYTRIDQAFYREKQVQGWGRAKKKALIDGQYGKLPGLAGCGNYTRTEYATLGHCYLGHCRIGGGVGLASGHFGFAQ
jgi:putative endonuclease